MSVHMARPFTYAFSLDDYRQMFDLSDTNAQPSILDYPAGFSSFNAEMHKAGYQVTSADPSYELTPDAMLLHVEKQLTGLYDHFNDHQHTLVEQRELNDLLNEARACAEQFCQDFLHGRLDGRYEAIRMPGLPYQDNEFDLVVSSHWLFSDHPDSFYQMQTLREMVRVGHECRIFPVLDVSGEVSPSLGPLMIALQQENYGVEVREVDFALQEHGNAMLRVWATECQVD